VEKSCLHAAERPAPYAPADYLELVGRSVVDVLVNRADLERLFNVIRVDVRKDGSHGRGLSKPVRVFDMRLKLEVLLERWDRLELAGCVFDVHASASDVLERFPVGPAWHLRFWRMSAGTCLTGSSAIFHVPGFSHAMLMVDTLHTLDLGLSSRIAGHVFAAAVKSGVLGTADTEQGRHAGCRELTRLMRTWYREERVATRLGRITTKTLQLSLKKDQGHLKCKAAQARSVFPLTLVLLKRKNGELAQKLGKNGRRLLRSCKSLVQAYALMKGSDRAIDHTRLGVLLERAIRSARKAGVRSLPKFHLARHFSEVAKRHGNPKCFSCYPDESHNHSVVLVAQACRTNSFGARILSRERLKLILGSPNAYASV
jgi:hypothetical protein